MVGCGIFQKVITAAGYGGQFGRHSLIVAVWVVKGIEHVDRASLAFTRTTSVFAANPPLYRILVKGRVQETHLSGTDENGAAQAGAPAGSLANLVSAAIPPVHTTIGRGAVAHLPVTTSATASAEAAWPAATPKFLAVTTAAAAAAETA